MEKVILELIYKLDDILYGLKTKVYNGNIESIIINCFEPGTKARENEDEITEDDDIPEIIDMLEKELPNMLAYCKNTSISPEVELLIILLEETINMFGLTKKISYKPVYIAQLKETGGGANIFVNTKATMQLAERCKPWLYWLYKYYPKKEGDDAPMLKEMPRVLDTEQARKYFARAVEAGLMTDDYKWQKSKSLLAVFSSKMSDKLYLGRGIEANGVKRISWQPFEMLFEVTGLRCTLNDIQKTGKQPKGIEIVDGIFKD